MPIYSDLSQYAPTENDLVLDIESVYQSIGNILLTPTGIRLFNPGFGSGIEELLFEPMDELTAIKLYDTVIFSIEKWEPRVTLNYGSSTVTPDYPNRCYEVKLYFNIVNIDSKFELTYTGTLIQN